MSAAGLDQERYPRLPDWEASAADRLPFPRSQAARTSCVFDGKRARFHHPLGGGDQGPLLLEFPSELPDVGVLEGEESRVQPVLAEEGLQAWPEGEKARARFFAHWRLWRQFAREKDWRFSYLPADTRIPDHTIWHHMQVTSALAGCALSNDPHVPLRPAFLKLQIGPVQDFISAARSTRDLWSGSYLLSWLMARGLWTLAWEVGPDSVMFPSLWQQPLFDLQGRDKLWEQISLSSRPGAGTCWEAIKPDPSAALTPNLPNVFLALVPADRAEELARMVEKSIRKEFKTIASKVWGACDEAGLCADEGAITRAERKARFDDQINKLLSVSWQITPWPGTLDDCLNQVPGFSPDMPVSEALKRVETIRKMAEKLLPPDHRDSRYYQNSGKPDYDISEPARLKNRGLAWSVLLAHNAWEIDAVRQLRPFEGRPGGWSVGTSNNKDHLNGKDEAVAGGDIWCERTQKAGGFWPNLFKHTDWLGAATLVKRVWHKAYLGPEWGIPNEGRDFKMPNVHGLAAHAPFSDDEKEEPAAGEKYFAVLAFDGDKIGEWVSGKRTPRIRHQLADYSDAGGVERHGMLEYFERESNPDNSGEGSLRQRMAAFLDEHRAVSPSYHLQFSEALGNFALRCVAPIVEAYDGRLIYAGGDDVLALLPADTALACAADLNRAFQGRSPAMSVRPANPVDGTPTDDPNFGEGILGSPTNGFITDRTIPCDLESPVPLVVPGPAATASVGIAMAHFKSPLQDVVRAAKSAEKRAKNKAGRNAIAVSIFKRSGEITEWECPWEGRGLDLYQEILRRLKSGALSGRFPHRVCQLLSPYLVRHAEAKGTQPVAGFPVAEIIQREFLAATERQSGPHALRENEAALMPMLGSYLAKMTEVAKEPHNHDNTGASPKDPGTVTVTQRLLESVIGLCTCVAFAARNEPDRKSSRNGSSTQASA